MWGASRAETVEAPVLPLGGLAREDAPRGLFGFLRRRQSRSADPGLPRHGHAGFTGGSPNFLEEPTPPEPQRPRRRWWRRKGASAAAAVAASPSPWGTAPLPARRPARAAIRRGGLRRLVRLLLRAGLVAGVAYPAFVIWDTGISREDVLGRAYSPRVEFVPARHAGRDGRPYDAALVAPLYLPADHVVDPQIANAFIAAEDRKFRSHLGFDWLRTPFAVVNEAARQLGFKTQRLGGSTITMQLVKNLYLSRDLSPLRKLKEVVLAVYVDAVFDKEDILRMYLDNIPFGNGQNGIEAAARHYFGRSVAYEPKISVFQAALLARTIRSPSLKNPERDALVLGREAKRLVVTMAEKGFVSQKEVRQVLTTPVLKRGRRVYGIDPHFMRDYALRSDLPAKLAGREGRYVAGLTLEPEAQLYADRAMRGLIGRARAAGYDWAAIVVMRPDGAVAAMSVGGDLSGARGFNPAVDGRRSFGSLLKPFMAACALEEGARPQTMLDDRPREFRPGWMPGNADDRFLGPVSLRDALIQSRNPPFVQLFDAYGYDCLKSVLDRLGFRGQARREPGVVLGNGAASLLDMTALYASLAKGGRIAPYGIAYAREADGTLVYRHAPAEPRARVGAQTRCAVIDMLRGVVSTKGTGRKASWGAPLAGKTGTSDDHRDAWFVGFTEAYVAGVWIGRAAATPPPIPHSGGDLPAEAFREVMRVLDINRPPSKLGCGDSISLG